MATGHQTSPNIYNERYPASGAADQWGNVTLPRGPEAQGLTGYGITDDAIPVVLDFGAGSETKSVVAPCTGKLAFATIQSQTTTDGTNKITIAMTNESNSAASMVPSVTYDDDPVLTSNTAIDLTLSTTVANLDVDVGDQLEAAYTEAGTIAGFGVTLWFVANK